MVGSFLLSAALSGGLYFLTCGLAMCVGKKSDEIRGLNVDRWTSCSWRAQSRCTWDVERLKQALVRRIKPPFQLAFGARIFTVGSCFARNIEEQMGMLGLDMPMLDFTVPREEHDGARAAGLLNKYTPPSICQEFEWFARILKRGCIVRD